VGLLRGRTALIDGVFDKDFDKEFLTSLVLRPEPTGRRNSEQQTEYHLNT
jgi:hypothetical protein